MASASTPQDPNATIAELRRANAALQQERDAALVREVALAEVLEIINRSPGDPAPVFEAILEKAHRLCGADLGSLTSYDGDFFHAVATRGYPAEVVELLALQRHTARAATPPQRLLAGERFVNIPDLSLEQGRDDNPVLRGLVEHGHVRTNLLVPLRKGDALLGYIAAARREVRPFSEAEVALLESFAAQAVIAMENARLLTEQQEALERQTATAEVLQVINASPGDLTPVFDAILRNALRLCQATFGEFHVQVGESSLVPAVVGVPADYAAFCATYSFPPNPGTIAVRLNAGEPFVHIPDLMDTDAYRANDPGRRAMVELGGARSVVAMAMRRDGRYCGAIVIFRSEAGPFSERLIALLRNFAAQAEIAMENARLLNELRDRTDELAARNTAFAEQIDHQSATIDVLKAMSASPGDPQPVFDLIAVRARDVCQAYGVTVCEYDGALIHWRANTGLSDDPAVVERFKAQFPAPPTPDTIFGRTVVNRDVVHIRDLAGDPRIDQARRGGSGARSSVGVPLLRDGAVIGALVMGSRALGGFSDSQVQLLQTFAEQAVIAIRSAETYSALEARTAALAQRNSEFGEQIDHQSATIDVLKAMSASPGDAQPVLELIARRARDMCDTPEVILYEYDGELVHIRAEIGNEDLKIPPEIWRQYVALFPMPPNPASLNCRAIIEGKFFYMRDLQSDPAASPLLRSMGHKSQIAVPLMRDGRAIGAIGMGSQQTNGFSDTQIELVKTFAEQAVIAIRSAETFRELEARTAALAQRNSEFGERIDQQAATIEVLKVMSASPDDTQPVFDQIVRRARELCNARGAGLFEFDGELMHFRATCGPTWKSIAEWVASEPEAAGHVAMWPMPPARGSITSRAILDREIVHIRDMRSEPGVDQSLRELKIGSQLSIPLLRDGVAIGAIMLGSTEPGGFTDSQVELLKTFAEQAVIAIGSVATWRALRERTAELAARNRAFAVQVDHQAATIDVLKVMSSTTNDTAPVFDIIVRRAIELAGAASGSIFELEGGLLHLRKTLGHDPEAVARWATSFPQRPNPRTPRGRAVIEGLTQYDRTYQDNLDPSDTTRGLGTNSIIAVPMLRDGAPIGVITVSDKEFDRFNDSHIALLQTFAEQAVIAIGSVATFRELQQRTAELAARNSEFGERIDQQAATIDVLKVMSASPEDTQPIFDQIVRRAQELCNVQAAALFEYDGELVHYRAAATETERSVAEVAASRPEFSAYIALFPMPPTRQFITCRAILDRQIQHVRDRDAMTGVHRAVHGLNYGSQISIPLLRDGAAIGAISLSADATGGFTDSQVELLKTFAEQAVIAIGSVATFRELRQRTAELAVQVAHQAATIDVLKAMSSTTSDTKPVFDTILRRALEFCNASMGALLERSGDMIQVRSVLGMDQARIGDYFRLYPRPLSREWHIDRAILDGKASYFPDLNASTVMRDRPAALRALELRSQVQVPLMRGDVAIGAIALVSQQVDAFNDAHFALLQTFAEQAVIAIGSVATFKELQDRTAELDARNRAFAVQVAHQAATIDVLKVMSSISNDTQPVFDIIAGRAMELCAATGGAIYEFDGQLVHFRCARTDRTDAIADFIREYPKPPDTRMLAHRSMLEGRMIYSPDIRAERGMPQSSIALGHRSCLSVPLMRDGTAIGTIVVVHDEVAAFTDSHIELLQTFAEQAVIAIGSVATFKELQDRTAELTRSVAELQALEEVLRAVNSSLDLETVLATIISRAVQLSQSDEGTIYEFDAADEVFVPKSAFGMTEERIARVRERRIRMGETHVGRSAELRAPVQVDDVQNDPGVPEAATVLAGIHAVLAVPLLREANVVGGLVIRRRTEGAFAPATVALMQTFAAQSVLAIENARLFEAARRARAASDAALADLRRAQDRLVQTEKMASLGQLTAGIAHEIKNPLNFVNNFSELSTELIDELREALAPAPIDKKLRSEIDDLTGLLRSNLEKVVQHGKRADGIVKNMLLHSRESGGEQRRVEVNTIVEEALNLAYHGARAEKPGFNISLVREFDPAAGTLELYPQEFTRVLLNLISNGFYAAIRKQADGGDPAFEPTLTVATEARPGEIAIRVRDNGIGIPDAVRAKMFEPFFTTKPAGEGTGLGLSLSHDIVVKQHGGSIAVDTSLGAFTEFTVTLPRPAAP